ncbi:MAG: hypothetical protein ACRC11_19710 [Xenococcaceae cyanobacterium]
MSLIAPPAFTRRTTEADEWILNFGSAYLQKIYSDRDESWLNVYLSERRKTDYPCWILVKTKVPLPKLKRSLTKKEQIIWQKHPESYFSEDGSSLIIDNWQPGYSLTRSLERLGDKFEADPIDYLTQKLYLTCLVLFVEYSAIAICIIMSIAYRSPLMPCLYLLIAPFGHGILRIEELETEMRQINPNYKKL